MKKMTKFAAVAAALALGAALLAGCSGASDAPATDGGSDAAATPAADAPTLIVGLDNAYPPYGFIGPDGNLTGFDIDLATEVAARNGWNLELEAIDWDAKDVLLGQGTINCIWNGFTMEGRENDYAFSDPYMLNEQVVVVRADSGIKSLEDLAGKNVMTQVDSAALDVLQDEEGQKALADTFAGGAAQTIGDYNNAFMQLESGAVDAVACDLSIADYQMAAKPDMFVKLEPLSTEHYAVGFAKDGDAAMIDAVNKTLKEMYDDGTIEKLCEKWGEYGITIDNWVLVD
ncbi:transporter substrate-binding domain-containing protein [uncultured Adlercreutzia sp.]|uniref:transporter substrate-binding domain-containing protein n=1 Tax=uncultured Adlercreutzia sp. TaxID=875803 RepID=UPI002674CF18|nr:transporter substrate-binding domain-containing protein [uncultured Adlercreutzia sp.]